MSDVHGLNGKGFGATIVPWLAIAMSLGAAFWTVANPRDDIKQVETRLQSQIDRMLPRSVHDESILRLDRDFIRLTEELFRLKIKTCF